MKIPQKWALRIAGVVVFILSLIVVLLLELVPWFSGLERTTYDYLFNVRGIQEPVNDMVVVGIDENSLQELGPWPWDRSVHGYFLAKLKEFGARAAVFDIVFDVPKKEDAVFAEGISLLGKVVLGRNTSSSNSSAGSLQTTVEPNDTLLTAGGIPAYVDTPTDSDTRIRRSFCLLRGQSTLATEGLFLMTGERIRVDAGKVFLGDKEIPAEGDSDTFSFRINYTGKTGTIPKRSYYQVLEGTIPRDFLKDKLVFVGYDLIAVNTSQGAETDRFPTPVDENLLMPGVEIHANAYHTLRTQSYIRHASPAVTWSLLILLGILATVYSAVLRPIPGVVATLGTVLLTLIGVIVAFVTYSFFLPPTRPIAFFVVVYAGNTAVRYRTVLRERAQIQKAFKHYVSVEVLGELMKNPESLQLGGEEVVASVLFTDIAGFSKISEKITPHELTQMLNDYFERLASIIMKEKGMVNKFIGDAVMAIWGAPLPNPNHAIDACRAALQMQRAMVEMDPIRCRVGINSGTMVAGNLGSRERFEYTVIGDSVNLASRLEGVNKPYHTEIMISEMTEELVRGHFLLREVDSIRVVGKQQPVKIFQLLDNTQNADNPEHHRWLEMLQSFTEGLQAYKEHNWEAAALLFEKHVELFPEDPVGGIYLGRCHAFMTTPPAEDWDGVFQMETK